ncbi:MAG: glutathione S-transferase family protein [Kiloniellales bacterium]|nr:glutathione S-transferase family protein [Kiloniellales bacterium]
MSGKNLSANEEKYLLVSHHLCPYVQRAAILLAENGTTYERRDVDLSNKPDWFKEISPLGKVPLLKVGDKILFESAVICEYLDEMAEESRHPEDPLEKAYHRSWIEFGSSVLNAIGAFYNAKDASAFEVKRQTLREKFDWLEAHLHEELENGPKSFFAGPKFHLVDAAYGPVFRYLDVFDRIADFGLLEDLRRTQNYRRALTERPSVRSAVSPSYAASLLEFLQRRESHISSFIKAAA